MKSLRKFLGENKLVLAFLFLGFLLIVLLTPDVTTPGKFDRRCWIAWSNYINGNGLPNIYKLDVNYLPLYHYVLFVYTKIVGTTEGIIYNVNSLKYITYIFEFIGLFFVYLLVKDNYRKETIAVYSLLLIMLNPAFLYDSFLYGQVDGIYASVIFIAVFFGIRKRPALSLLTFMIALNFKLQAITFLPLIFFLNIEELLGGFSIKKILLILWPTLLFQFLILLPFILGGDLKRVLAVIVESEGMYPLVSMGAFNWWYFFFENPKVINDTSGFLGRSYKRYGQLVYIIGVLVACGPYFKYYYLKWIKKAKVNPPSTTQILLMGILMSLLFFYFNTEMHSRYIHAAIIFAGAYALYTKRYLIYAVLSLAYFLNIENSAKILKGDIQEYESLLFNPVVAALLFLVSLILCYYNLFKDKAGN